MQDDGHSIRVSALEKRIATLTHRLAEAKAASQEWTDAKARLALSAAEARAENQGHGRGFFASLLGSKYRGIVRRMAAASNASISQDVVEKRARIADGKRESQEVVRRTQDELAAAKRELKAMTTDTKAKSNVKTASVKATAQSIDLLHKLKEARDAGLLSEAEFEEKRRKLVRDL
jgi:hypothetical protein